MNIKKIFKEWLKEQNVYEDFAIEVLTARKMTVDQYLTSLPNYTSFPGYFVKDAFLWPQSVTQNPKDAYDFWNSIHWRWKSHLNHIKAPDKSEFHERSF